ncbi:MAG: HD-GYP domain-containing protein [Pseudomonadota bacterium]
MIKKIPIEDLRIGMFIHDMDLSWINHPFIRNHFKVEDAETLGKVRATQAKALYIDTDKGLDVAGGQSDAEVRSQVQATLTRVAKSAARDTVHTPLREEWQKAVMIQKEAAQVLSHLMEDVRLGKQIETQRLEPVVDRMVRSVFRNQDALMGMLLIRDMDKYTFEHSVAVSVLLVTFAKHSGVARELITQIGIGGLLHDIGKTRVPLEILNKPGSLTEAEFEIMRRHVVWSREILETAPGISPITLAIAAQHHERCDGTGYPKSLKGDEINLYGQMASIVDCYDALTADRCYHQGKPPHWVLGKLVEWSKFHFNPELVQRFIRCVGIYPVGSLVALQSGRLGVVLESNPSNLLKPIVKILYDKTRRRHLTPRILNLSRQTEPIDKITGSENPGDYGIRLEVVLEPSG